MTSRGHIKRLSQRRNGHASAGEETQCPCEVFVNLGSWQHPTNPTDCTNPIDVFVKAFEAALKAFCLDGSQESLRSSTCGFQRNQIGGRCLMLANKKCRCDHVGSMDIFGTSHIPLLKLRKFHNTLLAKADSVNSVNWAICVQRQKGWFLLKANGMSQSFDDINEM